MISLTLKLSTSTYSSSNRKIEQKKRIQIYDFKISNKKVKSHMRNQATLILVI